VSRWVCHGIANDTVTSHLTKGIIIVMTSAVLTWFGAMILAVHSIMNNLPNFARWAGSIALYSKVVLALASLYLCYRTFRRSNRDLDDLALELARTIGAAGGSLAFMTLVEVTLGGGMAQMMSRVEPLG
jgi:membrane protein implicated in regulation of membrane protease activity